MTDILSQMFKVRQQLVQSNTMPKEADVRVNAEPSTPGSYTNGAAALMGIVRKWNIYFSAFGNPYKEMRFSDNMEM